MGFEEEKARTKLHAIIGGAAFSITALVLMVEGSTTIAFDMLIIAIVTVMFCKLQLDLLKIRHKLKNA